MENHYSQIESTKLLSYEEEKELSCRWKQGDDSAREKLIGSNINLVRSIALKNLNKFNRPRDRSLLEDLMQQGMIGLMEAADKYDEEKGFRFSTYASYRVNWKVQRYLEDFDIIRVPNCRKQFMRDYAKTVRKYQESKKRDPSLEEVAYEFNKKKKPKYSAGDISEILAQVKNSYAFSLDRPVKKNGNHTLSYMGIASNGKGNPSEIFEKKELSGIVREHLSCFNELEKEILERAFIKEETPRLISRALKRKHPDAKYTWVKSEIERIKEKLRQGLLNDRRMVGYLPRNGNAA